MRLNFMLIHESVVRIVKSNDVTAAGNPGSQLCFCPSQVSAAADEKNNRKKVITATSVFSHAYVWCFPFPSERFQIGFH
jgi:hypothetical protein